METQDHRFLAQPKDTTVPQTNDPPLPPTQSISWQKEFYIVKNWTVYSGRWITCHKNINNRQCSEHVNLTAIPDCKFTITFIFYIWEFLYKIILSSIILLSSMIFFSFQDVLNWIENISSQKCTFFHAPFIFQTDLNIILNIDCTSTSNIT